MNIKNLIRGEIEQEDLLRWHNANVIYKRLIDEVNGFVISHKNINCIVINYNKPKELYRDILIHELAHIELNHLNRFDKDLIKFNRIDLEDEADKYIESILNELK